LKGLLEAVRDHLVNIKARTIEHVMKERNDIPKDVRNDLIIILGRLNMSLVILHSIERKLEKVRKHGRKFRVKHTTHLPVDRSGFVHYKKHCLCQECVHFLECRLSINTITIKDLDIGPDTKPKWIPVSSEATEKIINVLKEHPEGLTVRQISILTGISARHVYRVVKALHAQGLVKNCGS
jgi:IclR helix-turn-helix domain.